MPATDRRSTAVSELRDQPAYPLAEAARYLRLPTATLRSWVLGRDYPRASGRGHFPAIIDLASKRPPVLSFWNLIEAHVLRALRTDHGVSVQAVRDAIDYAQTQLNIERLLLSDGLRTDAGRVFIERYGELINLSASGQLAMRKIFSEHLKRVDWGTQKFPIRLYPFLASETAAASRPIVIDSSIGFGRPILSKSGISTNAIARRIDAGETVAELAEDYDLALSEIEDAVLYERAA